MYMIKSHQTLFMITILNHLFFSDSSNVVFHLHVATLKTNYEFFIYQKHLLQF